MTHRSSDLQRAETLAAIDGGMVSRPRGDFQQASTAGLDAPPSKPHAAYEIGGDRTCPVRIHRGDFLPAWFPSGSQSYPWALIQVVVDVK